MPRKSAKVIGVLFMALTLIALPVLVGCGGGPGGTTRVTVGFLGDFTGASAATCIELKKGMDDYLRYANENNPIPGVDVKIITYDSRLEYARVKPGYLWLRGQGMDILLNYNAMYTPMLASDHQKDKIPSFCFNSMRETMGEDYMYSFSVDYKTEGEAALGWLVQDWQERGNTEPLKLGYLGMKGMVSDTEVGNVMKDLSEGAYAGEVEIIWESAPMGTTVWSNEIARLRNADIIFLNVVGPSLASFLQESLQRGYEGEFLGSTISLMGFWNLVRNAVNLQKIDGIRAIHAQMLWSDETDFVDEIASNLAKYRSTAEADQLKKGTSYPSGYLFAMILYETIRFAADKVGAENVDSRALDQALQELEMDVDGWGEVWKAREGTNIMHRTFRIIEYRYADDDWFQVPGGEWFLPESLK